MHDFSYNDATIEAYNQQFKEYIKNTPSGYNSRHKFFLHWIDSSLNQVPPNGTILEIGSGHGRDARYMAQKGFRVQRTDAAQSFVDYLNSLGESTLRFNILRDNLDKKFNMVYADGVVPHFAPPDLPFVLKKVYHILKKDGIFTFNTKQGVGEDWINEKGIHGRYTCYWDPVELRQILEKSGFKIILFASNISGGDLPDRIWIHVILQKA